MRFVLFLLVFISIGVNAQDLIVPKTGDPIKAYHLEVSDKYYFYTLSPQPNGEILKIEKEKVLVVRKADGTTASESSREKEGTAENNFPVINEEDIHGSLIAQGNCVYIPTNGPTDYEMAGQEKVREMVSEWDFWTVVDKPEQAHFILQFVTETRGVDFSLLIIRPRKYYREDPYLTFEGNHIWFVLFGREKAKAGVAAICTQSNENPNDNRNIAGLMCNKLYEILTQTSGKESKKWFKHNSKELDADAKDNNMYWPKVIR